MKVSELFEQKLQLNEGIVDRFLKFLSGSKNAKKETNLVKITQEQRDLIKRYFKSSNVDVRWGGANSKFVLEYNVHATEKDVDIAFYSDDGKLMASVAFYTPQDSGKLHKIPLAHKTFDASTEAKMRQLNQKFVEE